MQIVKWLSFLLSFLGSDFSILYFSLVFFNMSRSMSNPQRIESIESSEKFFSYFIFINILNDFKSMMIYLIKLNLIVIYNITFKSIQSCSVNRFSSSSLILWQYISRCARFSRAYLIISITFSHRMSLSIINIFNFFYASFSNSFLTIKYVSHH